MELATPVLEICMYVLKKTKINNNKNNVFKHIRKFNNLLSRGKIQNISLNIRVQNYKISPSEK